MQPMIEAHCKKNELVLLSQVAKDMNVPYGRLYPLAHKGLIRYKRVSKKMLIERAETERCIQIAKERGWIE
jgi:hypothetical protein